jgi:hypothetical protein
MHYCGIGSRSIPKLVSKDMEQFAIIAASKGWILRSGGATGSDSSFEKGCDKFGGSKEIYLPWVRYNDNTSRYVNPTTEAHDIARLIHPIYNKLSPAVKLLVARNCHLVLGLDLNDPVEFVICYTPDCVEHYSKCTRFTGGTGTAISLASKQMIPIFNICNEQRYFDAIDFLTTNKEDRQYEL